jgi:hypothetical protein
MDVFPKSRAPCGFSQLENKPHKLRSFQFCLRFFSSLSSFVCALCSVCTFRIRNVLLTCFFCCCKISIHISRHVHTDLYHPFFDVLFCVVCVFVCLFFGSKRVLINSSIMMGTRDVIASSFLLTNLKRWNLLRNSFTQGP